MYGPSTKNGIILKKTNNPTAEGLSLNLTTSQAVTVKSMKRTICAIELAITTRLNNGCCSDRGPCRIRLLRTPGELALELIFNIAQPAP
jgi:hypothetical protein